MPYIQYDFALFSFFIVQMLSRFVVYFKISIMCLVNLINMHACQLSDNLQLSVCFTYCHQQSGCAAFYTKGKVYSITGINIVFKYCLICASRARLKLSNSSNSLILCRTSCRCIDLVTRLIKLLQVTSAFHSIQLRVEFCYSSTCCRC